jgi:hypothetical protein
MRPEARGGRHEAGGMKLEAGGMKLEAGGMKLEAGGMKPLLIFESTQKFCFQILFRKLLSRI